MKTFLHPTERVLSTGGVPPTGGALSTGGVNSTGGEVSSKGVPPTARVLKVFFCIIGVLIATTACGPTTYPADVFPEMHYSPADRRQEPPREAPPADAVPVTGSTPHYSFDDATPLANPTPNTPDNLQHAQNLARINCVACHGQSGHGDGPVASYFSPVRPVDFRSQRVQARTDGQLFWLIANGIGNMPAFRNLLSENDLWAMVLYVRKVSNQ
jgi:mono/diheme cytochrome c family protein